MPIFRFDREYMRSFIPELNHVILMRRTAAEPESEFNSGYIRSVIQAPTAERENNEETLKGRALAELASVFERSNFGMVAPKESSFKETLKRVRVEDGEEEKDCMICLVELKVGLDASRIPCSHTFHGDRIEKWLKQRHYCPICRLEMPTN